MTILEERELAARHLDAALRATRRGDDVDTVLDSLSRAVVHLCGSYGSLPGEPVLFITEDAVRGVRLEREHAR